MYLDLIQWEKYYLCITSLSRKDYIEHQNLMVVDESTIDEQHE